MLSALSCSPLTANQARATSVDSRSAVTALSRPNGGGQSAERSRERTLVDLQLCENVFRPPPLTGELRYAAADDFQRPEQLADTRETLNVVDVEIRPSIVDSCLIGRVDAIVGWRPPVWERKQTEIGCGRRPAHAPPVERCDAESAVAAANVNVLGQAVIVRQNDRDAVR
jgi:hypothetical protein